MFFLFFLKEKKHLALAQQNMYEHNKETMSVLIYNEDFCSSGETGYI